MKKISFGFMSLFLVVLLALTGCSNEEAGGRKAGIQIMDHLEVLFLVK